MSASNYLCAHDGLLDLYVANGRVNLMMAPVSTEDLYAEPNSLLRGLAGGTREPVVATSCGAAFGNGDGARERFGPFDANTVVTLVRGEGR